MAKPSIEFPPRLVEGNDPAGMLLRRSFDEPRNFPSESGVWHGYVEKRCRPKRPLSRVFISATAVGAVCTLSLIWLVRRDHGAEPIRAYADASVASTRPSSAPPLPAVAREGRTANESKPQRSGSGKTESKVQQAEPTDQQPGSAEATPDNSGCARMAREGKLESAASCYEKNAQGSSMAAELALYEKARLESRALGRGAVALSTLDEHARRFPRGVLSSEVGLTRIELLTRLGRTGEALSAIEQALGGTMGKERGGDLYALRGDLLSSRGDCPSAMAAYALARAAGIHPSRLESGEKRCASSSSHPDKTEPTEP